jgi:hypothetical protein
MLKERTYKTAAEARAFLDGLTEVFDEAILPIGIRQVKAAPDEYVAAFVDKGRDDYSEEMNLIFDEAELEREDITGEEIVKRYLERLPNTEPFNEEE